MKNLKGKTRGVNDPYEIYIYPGWEWRVLKHNVNPDREKTDRYASCFCAVKGPGTFDGYDMGDTYISDILTGTLLTEEEMREHLAENHWREY